MSASVYFQGKKITHVERAMLALCFGETIDDMRVCHTVLIRAMQPDHALERGAIARALQTGKCEYDTGGRAVKRLIRAVRHDIGYKDPLSERLLYALDQITGFPYWQVFLYIVHSLWSMIRGIFRALVRW